MPFTFNGATVGTTTAVLDFAFTGGDGSYQNYRPLRLTINGTSYSNRVFDSDNKGGANSYWSISVSGLTPGTTYSVSAQLGFYTGSVPTWLELYATGSFTTAKAALEVEPWSWTASNGVATAAETQRAYNVLMGNVPCDQFSHKVWNDLVDKVVELRDKLYDGTWDRVGGKYTSLANCYVSSGQDLSAAIYNTVKYNASSIPGGVGSGIYDVEAGDELTGYHIYRLGDTINETIDALT